MGAEASKMVDDSVPPATLEKRSIDGIVKYIKDKKNCKIVVMVRTSAALLIDEITGADKEADWCWYQYVCWNP